MAESRIVVAAVCFVDDDGRVLTVRRSGTEPFILPGGKLRSDEGLASAALRAVDECLGITLQLVDLAWLGTWTALAANHPDHNVIATVFTAILPQEPFRVPVSKRFIGSIPTASNPESNSPHCWSSLCSNRSPSGQRMGEFGAKEPSSQNYA